MQPHPETTQPAPHVYTAIAAVTEALSKEGIAKGRKNQQQGFMFRGIDDVYNVLAVQLAAHGLCILPRVVSREVTEREAKSGGVLFSVTVGVDFDLVSAKDGSMHTVKMYGEAMDSGDKATNKAMSAAYKYMALEVFCIPTEGENDADGQTHEVAAKRSERQASGEATASLGSGKPPHAGPVTLASVVFWGKHKGKTVKDTGPDYFEWIVGEAKKANQLATPSAQFSLGALKALMPDVDYSKKPAALNDTDDDMELDAHLAAADAKHAAKAAR